MDTHIYTHTQTNVHNLVLTDSSSSGVAIEALCAPSSTHSTQTICICLEAFTELISSSWSQAKIAYNHSTCVEYVNVLHRTVLTRSNAQVHIQALKSLLLLQVNFRRNLKRFIRGCPPFFDRILISKYNKRDIREI